MPTPLEFAAKVKEMYPDYANVDDMELVSRVLAKYPEYRSKVQFASPKEQFQTIQRGIRSLNIARGALPGDQITADGERKDATLTDKVSELPEVQTAMQIPGFLSDAASRVGSNIGAIGSAVMHPIDTLTNLSTEANPITHASRAIDAARQGDMTTAAMEGVTATIPGAGVTMAPVKQIAQQVAGTLSGDRQQASNLTGDVATAALSEIIPAAAAKVAPGLKAAGSALGETIPPRIMNTIVNTGTKYFKFGANPGEALVGIKPDILSGTEGFKAPLQAKINMLARQANTVLNSAAAGTKMIDVIEPIESEIAAARQVATDTGNDAMLARLDKLEEAQKGLALKTTNSRYATPAEAQIIKQRIGDLVKWSSDPIEGSVNQVMQDIYRGIDRRIDAAVPAVKTLNERLANAITARKVVDNASDLGLKSDPFKLRNILSSQYVKSRVASGLRSTFGTPDPPLPETAPSPTYDAPPSQLALPPGREQRLLPAASTDFMLTRPHVADAEQMFFRDPHPTDMGTPTYPNRDLIQSFIQRVMQDRQGGATPPSAGTGPQASAGHDTLSDMLFGSSANAQERAQGGFNRNENPAVAEWPTNVDAPDEASRLWLKQPPSALLPPQFKHARAVTWGSPISGTVPTAQGDTKARAAFGVRFDPRKSPDVSDGPLHGAMQHYNTIMVGRNSTDPSHVWTHELGHAIAEQDLTKPQLDQWLQIHQGVIDDIRSKIAASGVSPSSPAFKPTLAKISADYPRAITAFAGKPYESVAETIGQYMANPSAFKAKYPSIYNVIKGWFGGREYIGGKITDGEKKNDLTSGALPATSIPLPEPSSTVTHDGGVVESGGDTLGRAKRELARTGITSEQRAGYKPGISEALHRGVQPDTYMYENAGQLLQTAKNFLPNLMSESDVEPISGKPRPKDRRDPADDDGWRLYLGMPQVHGTFDVSDYAPSKSSGRVPYYFKVADGWRQALTTSDGVENTPAETADAMKSLVANLAVAPNRKMLASELDNRGVLNRRPLTVLGDFTVSLGHDKRGPYVSYYDHWDFSSQALSGTVSEMFGKPFEVYDRVYYDPKTFEPKFTDAKK